MGHLTFSLAASTYNYNSDDYDQQIFKCITYLNSSY